MAAWLSTHRRTAVIFVAFVTLVLVRITWLIQSARSPQIVTPDEITFSGLTEFLSSGGDPATWSGGWGASIYPQSRVLVVPGLWLTHLGLDALTAVRVVSSIYAVGAMGTLIAMGAWGRAMSQPPEDPVWPLRGLPLVGLSLFAFVPSHFLWSSLGLREATLDFWILVAVLGLGLLSTRKRVAGQELVGVALVAIGTSLTFPTRPFTGWTLAIALVVGALFLQPRRVARGALVIGSVALGVLVGRLAAEPLPQINNTVAEAPATSEAPPTSAPAGSARPVPSATPTQTRGSTATATATATADLHFVDTSDRVANALRGLALGRFGRTAGADSAFDARACLDSQTSVEAMLCEAQRLPAAVAQVTVRPLWPWDSWSEASSTARLASVENVLWLVLLIAVGTVTVTRGSLIRPVTWAAWCFVLLTIVGMAAIEGNLGTAFRHKSVLLWAVCLPLVLAPSVKQSRGTASRIRPEDGETHQRGGL